MVMRYLEQSNLVSRILTPEELESILTTKRPLKIMMGQTYDKTGGQPMDLLTYSLFIMNLEDLLRQSNIESSSMILIADHFLTEITGEMTEGEAQYHGNARRDFLSKVNQLYNGNISFEFSSSLKKRDDYQLTLLMLEDTFQKDSGFASLINEAVPKDKKNLPRAFQYPLDELTSIVNVGTDIKIGPPLELYYDKIIRKYAPELGLKSYVAIHLRNSLPMGNPPIPLSKLPDGVLPYRFGSKGLSDYRIDLNIVNSRKAERLINSSNNTEALMAVIVTADLARQRLEGDIKPLVIQSNISKSVSRLKDMAKIYFRNYVGDVFGSTN